MNDRYLFLDDLRMPNDPYSYTGNPIYLVKNWEIVRDYKQFVDWINGHGLPRIVSFDHDLADGHYRGDFTKEKTGYDCAVFLVDYCHKHKLELPNVLVHSMNPVGKKNIWDIIIKYQKLGYHD